MKKLFALATIGLLSLSSFTTKPIKEEAVFLRCQVTVYSHDMYGNQYVDIYYYNVEYASTCEAIRLSFLD